jgi:hypothetical protein
MDPVTFRRLFPAAATTAVLLLWGGAVVAAAPPPSSYPSSYAAPAAADRDPLVDTVANGKGRVNYHAGVAKATGYGVAPARSDSPAHAKLLALGAARADALRTLAMTVSSIQVTANTTVRNYQLENDEVATRLSALLQSPRVVGESLRPDGTAVVTVELPLYGHDSVASAVLPEVLPSPQAGAKSRGAAPDRDANAYSVFRGPDQPAIRLEPRRPAAPAAPLPGGEPGLTPLSDTGPFTSVLIDCRGLGVQAIMSPKLYDTTGREVFGTVRVSPEYAIETGIVGYPRSMAEAIRSARAGSRPLIIKAVRAADKHRFHPVISLEDADRVLAANNRDGFLERTAVIFLVDPVK